MHTAIFFLLGILLHRIAWRLPAFWLIGSISFAALAGLLFRRAASSMVCLALALVAAGVAAAQVDWFYFAHSHISLFAGAEPRLAQVEIRVDDAPRQTVDPRRKHIPPRTTFPATVRRIKTWNGWIDASGSVQVSVSEPVEGLAAGEELALTGLLARPQPAMNPGQFDWASYYRSQRMLAQIHVNHACDVQILERRSRLAFSTLRGGASGLLARGVPPERETDGALLAALVLGERGPALRKVQDDFRHTGTSHLLASSGLRVTIFAAVLLLICRLCGLRPRASALVLTLSVVVLGTVMFPSPQALRPVLLSAALGAALLGRRGIDALQVLALGALVLLVIHPLDLYNAGFQLSFVTVAGLLLLTRPLLNFLESFENVDRQAARDLLWRHPSARLRDQLLVWLRNAFAVGLVAWAVSMPLVMYHFAQFNLWAVPIGILLSPLVFASLVGGFLKIALTLLVPPAAPAWAFMALAPVTCLRYCIGWLAKLPLADLPVSPPPIWLIVFYYLLICSPLIARWPVWSSIGEKARAELPLRWNRLSVRLIAMSRWRRCLPVVGCLILLWTPLRVAFAGPSTGGALRVTLLSLGAGQCAVIKPPDGRVLLIDAGSTTVTDVLATCLGPFLRHEGRSRIDCVCLSHGDFDHISAAEEAVRDYGVREVLMSPHFRRHAQESGAARSLLDLLDRQGRPPHLITRGDRVDLGNGAAIEVLWPPANSTLSSNNTGLVLRLTYRGRSILFPADIQEPPERELLRDPQGLKSDVLIAPHHGSSEDSTAAFVAAVSPALILSSNSARLTTRQRHFEQLVAHIPLYRTPTCGAITVTVDRDGSVGIDTYRSQGREPRATDATYATDDASY